MSADRIRVNLTETRGAIESLKALKATCADPQKKILSVQIKDYGQTHQKVEELFFEMGKSWDLLTGLIDTTIEFLEVDADMIDTTDREWRPKNTTEGDNWVSLKPRYDYGGCSYYTVRDFESVATKQRYDYNCTSTAWCMGLSIITGNNYDATSSPYWGENGANYVGYKEAFISNDIWQKSYTEIQAGKPVWFQAYNGNQYTGTHAVLIVGVSNSVTDSSILNESSFLVIDPADGIIKNLTEVGYTNYNSACINTYGDNLQ